VPPSEISEERVESEELRSMGEKKPAPTTPCASNIMAELKYPNMYWNVWKPRAKGKGYDCNKLLEQDKHILTVKAKFSPIIAEQKKLNFLHLKEKPNIKISLISGLLFPIETDANLKKIRLLLGSINSVGKIKQESLKGQDIAFLATLTFMDLMKSIAKEIKWDAVDHKDHLIFKASGRLLHSNKPFDIDIYLGPSVDYQKGEKHWKFLSNALNTSDFIFYSGHSGMGTTFSLSNLKKNTRFNTFNKAPDHQFIAVLSCSSISYFGDDFIKGRQKQGKTTDFLLTGFDNHAYRLTPAMIQFLDLELAEMNYSLQSILKAHLGKNEDVHLTRN
jgi:hypothetical protein